MTLSVCAYSRALDNDTTYPWQLCPTGLLTTISGGQSEKLRRHPFCFHLALFIFILLPLESVAPPITAYNRMVIVLKCGTLIGHSPFTHWPTDSVGPLPKAQTLWVPYPKLRLCGSPTQSSVYVGSKQVLGLALNSMVEGGQHIGLLCY